MNNVEFHNAQIPENKEEASPDKIYQQKEQEYLEKVDKMFQLARDIGSGKDIVIPAGEMWFKTWQDALDFQAHCQESGLSVILIEADPRPVTMAGEHYRIRPKNDNA